MKKRWKSPNKPYRDETPPECGEGNDCEFCPICGELIENGNDCYACGWENDNHEQ